MAMGETSSDARRAYGGPAILAPGFRPFFLGAGLWAAGAVALWLAQLAGWPALPSAFGPIAWHAHEMLFGFVAAALMRVLAPLTAIDARLLFGLSGLAWIGAFALCVVLYGPLLARPRRA